MVPARRTKIVATLGPASDSPEQLRALVDAGMDAARLNLSHGTHADHAERARRVRAVEAEVGRPIALIADLQGPKLRIGELAEPVMLVRGETITICAEELATDGELPIAPAVIGDVLEEGHDVLIDDGLVRLRVDECQERPRDVRRRRRRPDHVAQGRQPAGRPAADSVAHGEGRRGSRVRARARRRLRRAVVRALARPTSASSRR